MTSIRSTTLTVDEARDQLVAMHRELVRYRLVAWTAGNVSARARSATGEVTVIKPCGVSYDDLTAEAMIVCNLDGTVLEGDLAPSRARRVVSAAAAGSSRHPVVTPAR